MSDLIHSKDKLKILRLAIKHLQGQLDNNTISSLLNAGELEKYENPKNNTKSLSELIRFTINPNGMTIIFPAYTISSGANGVLSSEITFDKLNKFLTTFGKEVFSLF